MLGSKFHVIKSRNKIQHETYVVSKGRNKIQNDT